MEVPAIWSHFDGLNDPRVERTRRHQLMDIVIISVLAVVAGADGWSDIVQFAEDRQDWFNNFLELPAGIPCDDTVGQVTSIERRYYITSLVADAALVGSRTLVC